MELGAADSPAGQGCLMATVTHICTIDVSDKRRGGIYRRGQIAARIIVRKCRK